MVYLATIYWAIIKLLPKTSIVVIVKVTQKIGRAVGYTTIAECINSKSSTWNLKKKKFKEKEKKKEESKCYVDML